MDIFIVCIISFFIALTTVGCSGDKQPQEIVEKSEVEDGVLMKIDNLGVNNELSNKRLINQTPIEQGETINMVAYIAFKDDKLIIDEVELIKVEDTNRLKKLDVQVSKEMPNGDRLYNEDEKLLEIVISPNIVYRFTDQNRIYEKQKMDKVYETDKLDQFYEGSSYQQGTTIEEQNIPYFIEIIDGKVARVTEEYIYVS